MQGIMPNLAQYATHPSTMDSDWLEEDWDDEIKEEKMRETKKIETREGIEVLPTRTDIQPQPRERNPNFGNRSGPSSNTRGDQK